MELLDVVSAHALFPAPTSSTSVLYLALMDEWLTPLNWDLSPKLHACTSNCIFDSSTWIFQRHLKCNMAKTDGSPPLGHLFFSQYFLSLWVIAAPILLHKPQIYDTSLMLSSPSPQCPIHHQVFLIVSIEYLFNPSISLHSPSFPLISTAAVSSYLPSFLLSIISFACCTQTNLFKMQNWLCRLP